MAISKFTTAAAAVELIRDGDTVAVVGGGGGLVEASCLHEAIESRFLASGHPRNLTVVHALGIGDRKSRGMNRFAHEGMVRKVIGGHWVWSPRMQQLAKDEKIEAYVLPGGVAMQLFREIGALSRTGDVNVSNLAGTPIGPGGFIDIAQNAKKVVVCGTFDAKGTELEIGGGRLSITRHGDVGKCVDTVEQITFSGAQSIRQGRTALSITERAVFMLTAEGLALLEVAPGIDVSRDILDRMAFAPIIPQQPALMPARHFHP